MWCFICGKANTVNDPNQNTFTVNPLWLEWVSIVAKKLWCVTFLVDFNCLLSIWLPLVLAIVDVVETSLFYTSKSASKFTVTCSPCNFKLTYGLKQCGTTNIG